MRRRILLALIVGLVAVLGAAQAEAADRYFEVQVKFIAGGTSPFYDPPETPFPNCYSLLDDGTWIDPLFFNPIGEWEVVSEQAVTRYTATAIFGPFVLVQDGKITPSSGKGQVRLQALSTLYLFGESVATFMSTGSEADGCPPL